MKQHLGFVLSLIIAGLLSACRDGTPTAAHDLQSDSDYTIASEAMIRAQLPEGPIGHPQLFRAAVEVEPWFGGLYLENAEVRIVTTNLEIDRTEAISLASSLLKLANRDDLAAHANEVQLVRGKYSFAELDDWRNRMAPALPQFDLTYIDINEVKNSIDLGVQSEEAATRLIEWIEESEIPLDAVTVRVQAPIDQLHNWGGRYVKVDWTGYNYANCTLTQVVEHRTPEVTLDPAIYGITNSHCTESFGYNTGSGLEYNGVAIADEIWDHPLITNSDCVALTGLTTAACRYSDAALFKYRSSFSGTLYRHEIFTGASRDSLIGEEMVFVGDVVSKYGAATYLSSGQILATCVDVTGLGTSTGMLCQHAADMSSSSGDSGSPVWMTETVDSDVKRRFVGILWGGRNDSTYFSTAHRVSREIVPDDGTNGQDWGTICLSFDSRYCWY